MVRKTWREELALIIVQYCYTLNPKLASKSIHCSGQPWRVRLTL